MWSSLGKEKDPFVIIPAFPIKDEFKDKWPKSRIRKEIFNAETGDIMQVKNHYMSSVVFLLDIE